MSSAIPIGFRFIELDKVESTNNYAMGLVHAGLAQHGTAVFAHEQTGGKGQRDKQWLSAPSKNITITLVIEPFGLEVSQLFLLSMAVANGVQKFFQTHAGTEIKIKWPNDIYCCDRKAGGILIENVIQGKVWKHAIVGIGLNINQTDFDELIKAISLKQITGKNYDLVPLAKELLVFLDGSFEELINNPESVPLYYHNHLYKLNEKVHLKKGDGFIEGTLEGITHAGLLKVKGQKEVNFFKTGEVEWL